MNSAVIKSRLNRLAHFETVPDLARRHSPAATGCGETFGNPPNRDKFGSASVTGLFETVCPLAIFRRVVSVIILAMNGHAWRALAHVFEKLRKRLAPSLANTYSPASVICVASAILVITSLPHASPNGERGFFASPFGKAVFEFSRSNLLSIQTTARFCGEAREITAFYECCLSTIAATGNQPMMWVASGSWSDHGKPCKSGSDWNIVSGRHKIDDLNFVFSGGRPATTGAHCEYSALIAGMVKPSGLFLPMNSCPFVKFV